MKERSLNNQIIVAVREGGVRRVPKEKPIQEAKTSFLSLRECTLRWTDLVDSKVKIAHINIETDVNNEAKMDCVVANNVVNKEACVGQPECTRNVLDHTVPPTEVDKLRENFNGIVERMLLTIYECADEAGCLRELFMATHGSNLFSTRTQCLFKFQT